MTSAPDLNHLSPDQLRALAAELMQQKLALTKQVEDKNRTIKNQQALNDKLTFELATINRFRFGRHSEKMNSEQASLLDDLIDTDIVEIEVELEQISPTTDKVKKPRPSRNPLPAELPRTTITHEPDSTECTCGCQLLRVGEDVHEKLDYTPGQFLVEQHVRGKWACKSCETLSQAPVPAQIIDKGIPTARLLAYVLIAKYSDHLPLYRQEQIFTRAGYGIPRSTLAEWVGRCGVSLQPLVDALHEELLTHPVLHADETPVPMLSPGKKKTHQAYIWAYASTQFNPVQGVVYEFAPGRAGKYAREFLQGWKGNLVCDDFSGYKAGFEQGMTEVGCWAHARRKFYDLHVSGKSSIAEQALNLIGELYKVEAKAKSLPDTERQALRKEEAVPIIDQLYNWLIEQRQRVPKGSATSKAINYSLKRWPAMIRYLGNGSVPIDNNWVENQVRPWALGRKNWLFSGSLRSGQRAAAVMSLIQSAKINGHDPYAYLRVVLERLPTQKASALSELLPHNWVAADKV